MCLKLCGWHLPAHVPRGRATWLQLRVLTDTLPASTHTQQVLSDIYDKASPSGSFGAPPRWPSSYSRVCVANARAGRPGCTHVKPGQYRIHTVRTAPFRVQPAACSGVASDMGAHERWRVLSYFKCLTASSTSHCSPQSQMGFKPDNFGVCDHKRDVVSYVKGACVHTGAAAAAAVESLGCRQWLVAARCSVTPPRPLPSLSPPQTCPRTAHVNADHEFTVHGNVGH